MPAASSSPPLVVLLLLSQAAIGRPDIAVGLDVKGHTLAARGWTQEGGDLWETLGRLDAAGCARYVVTDVAKDGTMKGPNLHLLKQVCEATDRPVVAFCGDGGFQYHLAELETAVRKKIAVTVVVNDNAAFAQGRAAIRRLYGNRPGDPDDINAFARVDFAAVARAIEQTRLTVKKAISDASDEAAARAAREALTWTV